MEMNHSPGGETNPATLKKPYEKPSFRYEQVFVTSALTCGKMTDADHNCRVTSLSAS
jgi:hypothetical protein